MTVISAVIYALYAVGRVEFALAVAVHQHTTVHFSNHKQRHVSAVRICQKCKVRTSCSNIYEGESNENLKSAMKIRNTSPLSCKLTMMLMV